MRTVYVVKTHKYDKDTVDMVHSLALEVGPTNVIVVYDDTRSPLPGDDGRPALGTVLYGTESVATLTYGNVDAHSFNRYHVSAWHNCHEPYMFLNDVLNFEYDFVVLLEYDVRCLGSWKEAFSKLNGVTTDYLSNYMGDPTKFPDLLWDSFIGHSIPPMHERRVGLFAITRCSRRLVRALALNNGVYDAYCEVYVPTLAVQKGMSIGEFPAEMLGNFSYSVFKSNADWKDYVKNNKTDDRLYHAIKD